MYCKYCGAEVRSDGICPVCHRPASRVPNPYAETVYSFCSGWPTLLLAVGWTLMTGALLVFGLRTALVTLPFMVDCVLLVIGLWMLFGSGSAPGKRGAMTLLSGALIGALVLTALLVSGLALLNFYGLFCCVAYGAESDQLLHFGIAASLSLFLLPLLLLFQWRLRRMVVTARGSLRMQKARPETSVYAILLCFALAFAMIRSGLSAAVLDEATTGMTGFLVGILPDSARILTSTLSSFSWTWIAMAMMAGGAVLVIYGIVFLVYFLRINSLRRILKAAAAPAKSETPDEANPAPEAAAPVSAANKDSSAE